MDRLVARMREICLKQKLFADRQVRADACTQSSHVVIIMLTPLLALMRKPCALPDARLMQ